MGEYSILSASIIMVLVLIATASGLNELNVVQSGEILDKIRHGEQVRYDHIVVKGDLDLSMASSVSIKKKIPINTSIRMIDSTIDGNVYFNNAVFLNSVNFDRTIFRGCSSFKGSEFKGNSYFSGSIFNGTTNFEYVKFVRSANFWRSEFNRAVYFLNADFNENAFFIGAAFNGPAYFGSSRFNGDANFEGSKFYEFTNFAKSTFNRNAYYSSSIFDSEAYFWYSNFLRDAFFDGAVFSKRGNFNAVNFRENASFKDTQFRGDISFSGTHFNNYLDLSLAKYEKFYLRWGSINKLVYDDTAYQLLIENFKNLGFYADANNCYYRYRIENWKYLPLHYKPVDLMLNVLYGYGTKPELPIIWAILVILFSAAFFYIKNGVRKNKEPSLPEKRISMGEALLFSATYFSSGASSIISSEFTEFTPVGRSRYVAVIERLFGWILFALFLTALANTVIR